MFCKVKGFNKKTDICPVDQFGFVDVTEAFANGYVPASAAPTPDSFNGIDNPDSILGRPADIFEAYRMNKYISGQSSSAVNSSSDSPESVAD